MSIVSTEIEPMQDPGPAPHVMRNADIDPKAEKRAEQQVAILFGLSGVSSLLLSLVLAHSCLSIHMYLLPVMYLFSFLLWEVKMCSSLA